MLMLFVSISICLSIQAQVSIPFVWDSNAWRGTITDPDQQIIPASVATGTIYLDVVKERLGTSDAIMGVEGWTGTNSWSFPAGYSGGSSPLGQFVVVSQPGLYTNHHGGPLLGIQVNFLSDPFVTVDGVVNPAKKHLTDWTTGGNIVITANSSVQLDLNAIFAPPNGGSNLWKNGVQVSSNQTSYQITHPSTSSDNYELRVGMPGNNPAIQIINFKVIITPPTHTITASAGANGTISPNGAVPVAHGASQTFTFNPATGYEVDVVTVNGTSVSFSNNQYTFGNVMANHSIHVTFKPSVQQNYIPFEYVDGAWRGTITDPNQQIIPATVATGTIYVDVVKERAGASDAIMGVEGWTGQNSWSFPAGYSGGSSPLGQFVVVSQPGTYTNIYAGSVIIKVNFLSDPFVTVDGSVNPAKQHLTDWTEGGNIIIPATTSVGINFNPIFALPNGFTELWRNGMKIAEYEIYYQITTSGNYKIRADVNGNSGAIQEINFQVIITLPTYTLTPSVTGGNGTITPSNPVTVNHGSNYTFNFNPATGYEVDQVKIDGNPVSFSNNQYTFSNVTQNHTINVTFKALPPPQYSVTVSASPTSGGNPSVDGGNTHPHGSSVTVRANTNAAYNFVNWTKAGVQQSTQANYTFTITESVALTANFTLKTYTILGTFGTNGTMTPSGNVTVNHGENKTFTFFPNDGYEVDVVTVNGSSVSFSNNQYTFNNVTANANIHVTFKQLPPNQYSVTVSASPTSGGNPAVDGGNTHAHGSSVTVRANTNTAYNFVNWTKAGVQQSTQENYTFTITESVALVANFTLKTYTILGTFGTNGTMTPSGSVTVNHGENQTFTFIPADGYEVDVVTVNGAPVTFSNNQYTFNNVTAGASIHVTFKQLPPGYFTITATPNNANWGTATGGGSYPEGSAATLIATPATNYRFVKWTESGAEVHPDSIYTFTVTGDRSLVAVFEKVVGIASATLSNQISVYPNPTSGELKIENGELKIKSVEVFDVYGRRLLSQPSPKSPETVIDISHLTTGVYFLRIHTEAGQVIKKVLKE